VFTAEIDEMKTCPLATCACKTLFMNNINYLEVSLAVLIVAALVVWLVRRNIKDEKKFEKDMIQSEMKPDTEEQDERGDPLV
jgi:hypothetical protein